MEPLTPPPGWRFAQPWPCTTCPFRNDIPFYLVAARAAGIAGALRTGGGFTCHKTVAWDDADHDTPTEVWTPAARQCAGALATLLANDERLPDVAQVAYRLGLWDPGELAGAPVHPDLDTWQANLPGRTTARTTRPEEPPDAPQ